MKPIEAVNDFVVKFAKVNGSGSASANELFARSILRMGVPVSPRNIFPSNIQGLPTWYEVRVTEKGYLGRRVQALAQVRLFTVPGEGDAVHRADVDAGIAFDAQTRAEHRLRIAIETALRFLERGRGIETLLNFDPDVLERDPHVVPGHLVALVERNLVVIAPLVDAHLLRHHREPGRGTFSEILFIE